MQLAGMVREDVDPEWVTATISTLAAGLALTSPHDHLDDVMDGIAMMLDRSVDAQVDDTTAGKIVFSEYATSLASRSGRG